MEGTLGEPTSGFVFLDGAFDAESHSRTYDPLTTRTQQLILMHDVPCG